MTAISGILGPVSEAVSIVGGDKVIHDTEDHEPLLTDSDSMGYLSEDEGTGKEFEPSTAVRRLVWKSHSDTGLRKRTGAENDVAGLQQLSPPVDLPSDPGASLPPSRTNSHRSSSDSRTETRSYAEDMIGPETARQRETMTRLVNTKHTDVLKRRKYRRGSGASSPAANDEEPKNTFEWRSSIRTSSDPNLHTASSRHDSRKPLKTCLKQKAKSANTTPPNEITTVARSSFEKQELRRVKTVDFERISSRSSSPREKAPGGTTEYQTTKSRKASIRCHSCPGTASLARRSLACPAITRTDVHVVAITPSPSKPADLNRTYHSEIEDAGSATPTMQIVESGNGSYEVVWDDVPPEHSARTRRRSSSASQALEAAAASTRGLDRVNTKLTEWSGTWNTPSDCFKPTIVVFPDDDGRRPHFTCAVVDEEDIEIFAPPNSERVSAVHSRHPSRPTSARMSRAASYDEFGDSTVPRDTLLDEPDTGARQTLVVPDPEAWSAHLIAARRKLGMPSPERKLSNVEEVDFKFRNHRDSVTLAHSRLVHSGGVRPELFTHGDSVKLAKKRMHAKNHQHARRTKSKSEPDGQPRDEAAAIPPLPAVKAHPAAAPKHGAPAPILRSFKSESGRHIRIEEQIQLCG